LEGFRTCNRNRIAAGDIAGGIATRWSREIFGAGFVALAACHLAAVFRFRFQTHASSAENLTDECEKKKYCDESSHKNHPYDID
jgi:hypothetical protein